MKKIALFVAGCAIAVSAWAAPAPAEAAGYPWCARYGNPSGVSNCGFATYRQCVATVSGIGGFCERNQFYEGRRRR